MNEVLMSLDQWEEAARVEAALHAQHCQFEQQQAQERIWAGVAWREFGERLVERLPLHTKVQIPHGLAHPDDTDGFKRSFGLDTQEAWRMELAPGGPSLHVERIEGELLVHADETHFDADRPETYVPHATADMLPALVARPVIQGLALLCLAYFALRS